MNRRRLGLIAVLLIVAGGVMAYSSLRSTQPPARPAPRGWAERGFIQGRIGQRSIPFSNRWIFVADRDNTNERGLRAFRAGVTVTDAEVDDLPAVGEPFVVLLTSDPIQPAPGSPRLQPKLSEAGIGRLAAHPDVRYLCAPADRVTDDLLKKLRAAGRLYTLRCYNLPSIRAGLTAISNGGIELYSYGDPTAPPVPDDSQLAVLSLTNSSVTDAGLKELVDLAGLTNLSVVGCSGVTESGVRELQARLPKCEIQR